MNDVSGAGRREVFPILYLDAKYIPRETRWQSKADGGANFKLIRRAQATSLSR